MHVAGARSLVHRIGAEARLNEPMLAALLELQEKHCPPRDESQLEQLSDDEDPQAAMKPAADAAKYLQVGRNLA